MENTERAELTASYCSIPPDQNLRCSSQHAVPDQIGSSRGDSCCVDSADQPEFSALSRGIVLFGATVQAINIAMHIAAQGKNTWSVESNFRVDNEAQGTQIKGGDVIVPN